MKFLREVWRGEKSLFFTFWGMWLGGSAILMLLLMVSFIRSAHDPNLILLFSTLIGGLIYEPFVMVCVWNSARKTIEQGTIDMIVGYLARLFVLLGASCYLWLYYNFISSVFQS